MGDDRDPRLTWSETGEPRSGRYGDVYFSAEDGLAESRMVFLSGCGLPEAWAGRDRFTVGELGFGTGLNIVALLDLWRRTRAEGARLHIFSVEAFPLSADEARRALSAWPELADLAEALLSRWPPPTPGFHRIDLPELGATLDLAVGDAAWALTEWRGQADAWFLDGFAPSANPDMWSDAVLGAVAARSAPGARLATFTVAGAVRRGLTAGGFVVDKHPGHGRKRERLETRRPGTPPHRAMPRTVAVVGGGIAGAALARALGAVGAKAVVVEADRPGAGASGFPAALVTPRFDLGDPTVAALFAQALKRARALYAGVPGAVIAEGVRQRPATARDPERFARIAAQSLWAAGAMTVDPDGGLVMAEALTVHPAAVLDAWLSDVPRIGGRAATLTRDETEWSVVSPDGETLVVADAVVIAGGWGTAALAPALGLAPVRGQAEWTIGETAPATAWGGYVAPTRDGVLFGATHDRGQPTTEVRAGDTARNLATLAGHDPDLARRVADRPLTSRAAVRATTRDRLPLAGELSPGQGLYVLGGLGSRGFCLAPLLAEHVAAMIVDAPSPLAASVASRVAPGRAALRPAAEP